MPNELNDKKNLNKIFQLFKTAFNNQIVTNNILLWFVNYYIE